MTTLILSYFLADLLTGLFHWLEDNYGLESWPIIGPLILSPNRLHHSHPLAFTRQSYFSRNWTTLAVTLPLALLFYFIFPCPLLCLTFLFASQANEIHCWAHLKGKLPFPIPLLQWTGLIQSPRHHALHHTRPYSTHYCILTDWLNPLLESLHFFPFLEYLIYLSTGIKPLHSSPSK